MMKVLKNKIIGIIGLGRIGERIAEIANSFDMQVLYTGSKKEGSVHKYSELNELLQKSDIISLNVKAHRVANLLSQEKLASIKKGSYFINTSDGNAIDQKELTRKMLSGELFVGLDVYQGLPTTKTLCLDENINGKVGKQLNNHVLTYRAGWATQESIKVKTYKLLGHMIEALLK